MPRRQNGHRSGAGGHGNGAGRSENKDFEALGTLVVALERIASMELSQAANQLSYIDLHSLLEEVLIVIAPALREQEIELLWEVEPPLPMVWADRQSLMQVFLNLVKNSERAMEASSERTLTFSASCHSEASALRVRIRVRDTGTGVQHPELLFKPFQQQASATGLGLYLSRALMRSFSGELRYESPAAAAANGSPHPGRGACFVVELNAAVHESPAVNRPAGTRSTGAII
jgi:signal transduction histidine kinase